MLNRREMTALESAARAMIRDTPPPKCTGHRLDFEQWLKIGFELGWCGPPVCAIHDGLPTTAEEDTAETAGYDPCIHVLRLYEDAKMRLDVEANHGPSVWRASNRGLTS